MGGDPLDPGPPAKEPPSLHIALFRASEVWICSTCIGRAGDPTDPPKAPDVGRPIYLKVVAIVCIKQVREHFKGYFIHLNDFHWIPIYWMYNLLSLHFTLHAR